MIFESTTRPVGIPAGFFVILFGYWEVVNVRKLLVLILVFFAVAIFAEIVVVEGYGETLQAAKDDARRNALEQVNGAFIKSLTKLEDLTPVKDVVFSTVEGYVKIVKILEQRKESDETGDYWYVKAKVEVMKENVEKRLSDLMKEVGSPTVGVVIAEKYQNESDYSQCSYPFKPEFFEKLGFKGKLAEKGLQIQEIGALAEYNKKLESYGVSSEDLQDISSVSKDIASYIVLVKVDYVGRYNSDYGVCSVSMRSDIQIVRTDTGKARSLSYTETYAGYSPEKVIEWILKSTKSRANIERISSDVVKTIYIDRAEYAFNPKNIRVRIDLDDIDWIRKISELLENLPDVMNVTRQKIAGKTVIFALRTYHTPDKLWEIMKENLSSDLDMELYNISGDTIAIKVHSLMIPIKREIVLKFKIDKLSTGVKIKRCLMKLSDVKFLGTVSRGKDMYAFKIESEMDPDELMELIEEMDCRGISIEAEDIADDGSWILFSASK